MEGRHQWRVVSAGNGGVLVLCWHGREACWSCVGEEGRSVQRRENHEGLRELLACCQWGREA
ncbi:DEK domain-containing chromatin associated protein [Zea mays]|uniref:DEK domain-containing chromatin associated protein n=1 Tax=Zea mays TaxID=4577 RepID=A0A1D6N2P2_MAIZE|nr:DEK domain-containing chromatin associated protein [Zea mays]